MKDILKKYVEKFNKDDNEYYKQDIENCNACDWLSEQIPLIEIPDKTLEEIYYFRWWVLRKHIKNTEDGYVITEFLPAVHWAGKHNTIVAAATFHIQEAKWLKNGKKICEDYIKFWLDEKGRTYLYSSWLLYSLYELCAHNNDFSFAEKNLDLIINYFDTVYKEHITDSGLLWSVDLNDGMEFSISGGRLSEEEKKGLRPTLNSYMAANAWAIAQFAEKIGKCDIAEKYTTIYKDLKAKITEILWDGEFYKAIHTGKLGETSFDKIIDGHNVKELIGYIPWCFNLAPARFENAFLQLKDTDGFKSEFGLTTAEKRHSEYLYEYNHPCLWNGYIWPFATAQVLTALNNLLENYNQNVMTNEDLYDILSVYAQSHYSIENDKKVCWIDEVIHPETGRWTSREKIRELGMIENLGEFEIGKDYNHSAFCDIILTALLGIKAENGKITVNPKIPVDWKEFKVDNLHICGKCYKILYDAKVGIEITEK